MLAVTTADTSWILWSDGHSFKMSLISQLVAEGAETLAKKNLNSGIHRSPMADNSVGRLLLDKQTEQI